MKFRLLLLLPVLSGCIEHRASAVLPPDMDGARGCVNGSAVQDLSHVISVHGHLPQRLLVHGYRRADDGRLSFIDIDDRTPLPWWQRFPVDFATHCLWPGTLRSQVAARVHIRQPSISNPDQLTTLAHAAGYPSHVSRNIP